MDRDFKQLTVEARLEVLGDSIEALEKTVRHLDQAIRGNGSPGIQTRLALHEHRFAQIDRYVAEIQGLRRWLTVGVLSLLGSVAWQAVSFFLHQP